MCSVTREREREKEREREREREKGGGGGGREGGRSLTSSSFIIFLTRINLFYILLLQAGMKRDTHSCVAFLFRKA